jgi:hypothetical protein
VGPEQWFCRSADEWNTIAERLKQTPCPHCKVAGTLIRHGNLYGYDERNPQRKTVRARRIFCSNRNARPGCGRTFSVWCADKIRRLSLTTRGLWRFLHAPWPTASAQPSALPTVISVTGACSASGNASTRAKARSARHCRGDVRHPSCRPNPRIGRRRMSSLIFKLPSPTPTVLSPTFNIRCGPSSFKSTAATLEPRESMPLLTEFSARFVADRQREIATNGRQRKVS